MRMSSHGPDRNMIRLLRKVNSLKPAMQAMSDVALRNQTIRFKERLEKGEKLDRLLPEAYATVREAAKRILGMFPYDVQVLGAIGLHQGKIIEMKTGEGKTLVATMPLYLNALTGKNAILVTMNEYLAIRDGTEMERLFNFLGLTLGIGVTEGGIRISNARKKQIYGSDIVYTTSSALGFDYLQENLLKSPKERYMRELNYVIIDEADSVLLDMATMPLIISGARKVQSSRYQIADTFVSLLSDDDYAVEDKSVWLTESGIAKAERYFRYSDLFSEKHTDMMRHISLALRAHETLKVNEDYVVSEGKILLLDAKTGRILPSNKLESGLHEAIEAKEHVAITEENRSMASITYQSFFRLFNKMSGMTGTGIHDEQEFREIYHLPVVCIPTNHPVRRRDYRDVIFPTEHAAMEAAVSELLRLHATGEPVLMVCNSIPLSNEVSAILLREKIPHNMLNAYNTAKESEIVKEAGRLSAVTIATSVAGRGTDIKLSDAVRKLGGLAVIGLGRMNSRREEWQVRGRAGRQGDPGFSRFYVSPEDQVVQEYGEAWLREKYSNEDVEIESRTSIGFFEKESTERLNASEDELEVSREAAETEDKGQNGTNPEKAKNSKNPEIHSIRVRRGILRAQRVSEERGRSARANMTKFDESMAFQRNIIYAMRKKCLDACPVDPEYYMAIEDKVLEKFREVHKIDCSSAVVNRYILDHISFTIQTTKNTELSDVQAKHTGHHQTDKKSAEDSFNDVDQAVSYIRQVAEQVLQEKLETIPENRQRAFFRFMTLSAIDEAWVDEIEYLSELKSSIGGRQYAGRNIMQEYAREAYAGFEVMQDRIYDNMMRNIFLGEIERRADGKINAVLP